MPWMYPIIQVPCHLLHMSYAQRLDDVSTTSNSESFDKLARTLANTVKERLPAIAISINTTTPQNPGGREGFFEVSFRRYSYTPAPIASAWFDDALPLVTDTTPPLHSSYTAS